MSDHINSGTLPGLSHILIGEWGIQRNHRNVFSLVQQKLRGFLQRKFRFQGKLGSKASSIGTH